MFVAVLFSYDMITCCVNVDLNLLSYLYPPPPPPSAPSSGPSLSTVAKICDSIHTIYKRIHFIIIPMLRLIETSSRNETLSHSSKNRGVEMRMGNICIKNSPSCRPGAREGPRGGGLTILKCSTCES